MRDSSEHTIGLPLVALLLVLHGGCHLIFPFEIPTPESGSDLGPDVATDDAHRDVAAIDGIARLEGGPVDRSVTEGSAADMTPPDALAAEGAPQPDSGPVSKGWSKGFGASAADVGVSVATDSSGNVYLAGYFRESVNFGGGPIVSTTLYSHDVIVASYDPQGKHRWSKGFGGSVDDYPRSIALDAAGNVYVTGFFESPTMKIGGTTLNNTSKGKADIFVTSFTSAGVHRWSKSFGATGIDYGYGGATDGQGNLYITGVISNNVDFGGGATTSTWKDNVFVASFTSAGAHRWSEAFGVQGGDRSYWIAVDGKANLYLTGWFSVKIDLGGGAIASKGDKDIFIASFTSSGAHRWSTGAGSSGTDKGQAVAVDGLGKVYATGFFQGNVDLGGGPLASKGGGDIYLASFDSNGSHRWSKRFGSSYIGESGRSVALDSSGNVFLTGYFGGTVSFGGVSLTSLGSAEIFVASYDPLGKHRWSKRFGSTGSDMGHGIGVHGQQALITGEFRGAVNFGHGTHTSQGASADLFLLDLGP